MLAQMILGSDAGLGNKAPKLLLLCPPAIGDQLHLPDIAAKFPNGQKDSRRLPKYYEAIANSLGCGFLNTQTLIEPGSDGIHLDAAAHGRLGKAVAALVKSILPPDA
jgi:lysophospholipase L1-like esterase